MANLVDNWTSGQLPTSAYGVGQMLTASGSGLEALSNAENVAQYLKDMADDLKIKRDTVLGLEQRFYKQLNASGLEEIQRRLDLLNRDAGFRAMVNMSDSQFKQLVEAAAQKEGFDYTEPIEIFFKRDRTKSQVAELSEDGVKEIAISQIVPILNRQNKMTKMTASRLNKGTSTGLGSFLVSVTHDIQKNKFIVNFKEGKMIPSDWKKRLEDEYGVFFKQAGMFDQRKFLRDWLSKNIGNAVIKAAVLHEFDANANRYDLNSSEASVKGFLGEVHTAATLNILTNSQGAVATGNLRKIAGIGKGQEIPIDIIINEFGFQVKNYAVIKNKVSFGNIRSEEGMGAESFIRQRARIEGGMADLLVSLFGSYQFNQIDPDSDGSFSEKRTSIENMVEGENIKKIFDAHISNILKISEEFSSGEKTPFGTNQVYYNTFFMIGSKLVPSSAILQAIINKLISQTQTIESTYLISKPTGGQVYNDTDPQGNKTASVSSAANAVKISYQIDLNLEDILNSALSSVS